MTAAQDGERAPCNFLIDCGDLLHCGCPEDHELHDPLGPRGHHVYDPAPAEDGSYNGGRNEAGMMVGRFPKQAGVDTVALDDDVDTGGSDG